MSYIFLWAVLYHGFPIKTHRLSNPLLPNPQHHCRNCGLTYCQNCSSKSMPLPHFGITGDVRVCESCYGSLYKGGSGYASSSTQNISINYSHHWLSLFISFIISHLTLSPSPHRAPDTPPNELDEDLKRAIELSLKEQQRNDYSEYKPPPPRRDESVIFLFNHSCQHRNRMS